MGDPERRSRSPPPARQRDQDRPERDSNRRDRDQDRGGRDYGRRDRDSDRRDGDRGDRPRNSNRGGFKWKERRPRDGEEDRGEKRLERGYRQRSRSPRRDRKNRDAPTDKNNVTDKFGVADKFGSSASGTTSRDKDDGKPPVRAPAPAPAQPVGEPMIIVHVNDRLGTKAAIPCLASDPIKLFKAQVAARIGREPHEILLKRQGERPFKDQLTLEDYGVSNGVVSTPTANLTSSTFYLTKSFC